MKKPVKPYRGQSKFLKYGPAMMLCASVLLPGAGFAQNTTSSAQAQFAEAMEAYERNHWIEAFLGLSRLADKGDSQAARIAFQMSKYGPFLYKTEFLITGVQYDQWRAASKTDLAVK